MWTSHLTSSSISSFLKWGWRLDPLHLCTVTVRISVFTWVKLPIFSQQFYGPIAGALASKNNNRIQDLQNLAFDLVSRYASKEGAGSQRQVEGVKIIPVGCCKVSTESHVPQGPVS